MSSDVNNPNFNSFDVAPVNYFASILEPIPRIRFDAENPEHRQAYVDFELTGKMSLRFFTEWPSTSVPHTMLKRLALRACAAEFAKGASDAVTGYQLKNEKRIK